LTGSQDSRSPSLRPLEDRADAGAPVTR